MTAPSLVSPLTVQPGHQCIVCPIIYKHSCIYNELLYEWLNHPRVHIGITFLLMPAARLPLCQTRHNSRYSSLEPEQPQKRHTHNAFLIVHLLDINPTNSWIKYTLISFLNGSIVLFPLLFSCSLSLRRIFNPHTFQQPTVTKPRFKFHPEPHQVRPGPSQDISISPLRLTFGKSQFCATPRPFFSCPASTLPVALFRLIYVPHLRMLKSVSRDADFLALYLLESD